MPACYVLWSGLLLSLYLQVRVSHHSPLRTLSCALLGAHGLVYGKCALHGDHKLCVCVCEAEQCCVKKVLW
jgi:hypothetical protein